MNSKNTQYVVIGQQSKQPIRSYIAPEAYWLLDDEDILLHEGTCYAYGSAGKTFFRLKITPQRQTSRMAP